MLSLRIDGQVIACKAAQAKGAGSHPGGHFAQRLIGVFGEAEQAEILSVRAVAVVDSGIIGTDGGKRRGAQQFSAEQRLGKTDHVSACRKQTGMAAQVFPVAAE